MGGLGDLKGGPKLATQGDDLAIEVRVTRHAAHELKVLEFPAPISVRVRHQARGHHHLRGCTEPGRLGHTALGFLHEARLADPLDAHIFRREWLGLRKPMKDTGCSSVRRKQGRLQL